LPRFGDAACFAALLGSEENGRWREAPLPDRSERRRVLNFLTEHQDKKTIRA
jgi:hypothetical protein